jgi:hypothetical protein
MSTTPNISLQKLFEAAQGNPALLEVLQQIAQTTDQTQIATGQQKTTAQVPAQATGTVSVLNGSYIVEIVNPGGKSPLSQLQSAQAASQATAATSIQPIRPIFHQIRASTSPSFSVNSNAQTFGGDTGSTQTYWTLTGLGSGTWYIQFRSSYDGVNFNTWKNANGGSAVNGLANEVTLESAAFSEWAVFALAARQVMAIGEGLVPDQGIMGLASEVFSSGMLAIAGPNGFTPQYNGVFGLVASDVDIQLPAPGTPTGAGIPDYPVEIRNLYGISGTGGLETSPGNASVFAIAFNPKGSNVRLYEQGGTSGAVWAVFTLPGGAQIAVGQGRNNDGDTIWTPPAAAWIDGTRMMSICSLTGAVELGHVVEGFNVNRLSGLSLEAKYQDDGGGSWATTANWLAIAWQQGVNVQTVGSGTFLTIPLQGGHAVVIGAGRVASGTAITLPAGYTSQRMLSICTPGGADNTGNHLRGISQCSFVGLTPLLTYTDNTHAWSGAVNWMVSAWK